MFSECPNIISNSDHKFNVDISEGHLFGDTTLLECETGYKIDGSSDDTSMNISCDADGSWSKDDITCVRKGTIFSACYLITTY